MIDLAAASTAMTQLETALTANAIQVPDGAVQLLLDQKEWIYRSERVEALLKKLNQEQLYSVFNSEHQMQSASRLFEFLKDQGWIQGTGIKRCSCCDCRSHRPRPCWGQ